MVGLRSWRLVAETEAVTRRDSQCIWLVALLLISLALKRCAVG